MLYEVITIVSLAAFIYTWLFQSIKYTFFWVNGHCSEDLHRMILLGFGLQSTLFNASYSYYLGYLHCREAG